MYWAYAYSLSGHVRSDNGPQLIARYFQHAMDSLVMKHIPNPTYHPQNNGQMERYGSTFIARVRHLIAKYKKNCDSLVQPLKYAYNALVHRSTKRTPMQFIMSRRFNGLLSFASVRTSEDRMSAEQLKLSLLKHLRSLV